ncbi:hypothetical protein, partial [Streptomyces albidoflavus]|uniref:hypothetical protein n=1 Tax=Streptomyces albidoflavus TaxID=1886 RepID=UPI0033E81DCA
MAVGPVQPGRSGPGRGAEQRCRDAEPGPPQPGHRRLGERERGHRAAPGTPQGPGPEPARHFPPNAQNTEAAHGSALGDDEVAATKRVLGFDPE